MYTQTTTLLIDDVVINYVFIENI